MIRWTNGSRGPSRTATRNTRWRLTVIRTTSRGDIGRAIVGVSGRWSSKSKYIRGLHDYTALVVRSSWSVTRKTPDQSRPDHGHGLRTFGNVQVDDAERERDGSDL